jgi:putative transposase
VFPATHQQRDWVHKVANVVGCLPTSMQAGARKATAEIRDAPDREHAEQAIEVFARGYGTKWPKVVAKVTDDAEPLLCFFDFPAAHWLHLKTSNPIESTFSSVRLQTRVTKSPGSKAAGLAMVQAAGGRPGPLVGGQWGPHLVALVRAGARFDKGVMVERPHQVQEAAA